MNTTKLGQLHVRIGGEGDAFLFVHGMPGDGARWERVAAQIAPYYRVIVPDLLGFGQSENAGDDFYMEGQARALYAMLEALKINDLYIACHDFGVPVTLTLIRLFPQLQLKGLVISDAQVFSDTFDRAPLSSKIGSALGRIGWFVRWMFGSSTGARFIHRMYTKNTDNFPFERLEAQLSPKGKGTSQKIALRIGTHFKEDYQQVEAALSLIQCPVLILWGKEDPIALPTTAERLKQTLPQSTLILYPNVGHFLPEEAPQSVAEDILTFFKG